MRFAAMRALVSKRKIPLFQSLFAIVVVDVTLLLVGQDFIGASDGLESFFVTPLVWVALDGLLSVSFFDLRFGRILAKDTRRSTRAIS